MSDPSGDASGTEVPFFEREGWRPMTADQISRALTELSRLPGSECMYLPDFYCAEQGLDFEETNRSPTLKELIEKKKPATARERLQAKLEARKKSQQ
jgi:hypothetical protein